MGIDVRVYEVRSETELQAAFAVAVRDGVQALYVSEAPHLLTHRAEIAAQVASVRLPAMYSFREYVQSGGLMSYGADLPDLYTPMEYPGKEERGQFKASDCVTAAARMRVTARY